MFFENRYIKNTALARKVYKGKIVRDDGDRLLVNVPAKVEPTDDHRSHIRWHLNHIKTYNISNKLFREMMNHVRQHEEYLYGVKK